MKTRFLRRLSPSHRRRAGMSLVELSVASTLIVLVAGGIVQFSDTSWKAYDTLNQTDSINQRGWKGIEAVSRKVRSTGPATNLLSGVWLDEIQFRTCQGFENGEAVMGKLERLAFRLDAGEIGGPDNALGCISSRGGARHFPDRSI